MLGPENMSAIAIRHTGVSREVTHLLSISVYTGSITRKRLIRQGMMPVRLQFIKHPGEIGVRNSVPALENLAHSPHSGITVLG